jgi:dinuclear metal center YbgI/SA1388 family protein
MTIQNLITVLDQWAPPAYAEDFDNVGLLVGDPKKKCLGALITLDCTEDVMEEAINKKCNLIISFHPIVFSGLKKITGKNYVERVVIKAIQNNVAIIALHTRLDNHPKGVNHILCSLLELRNSQILIPKKGSLKKLCTYVPKINESTILEALHQKGAGAIGNYNNCSFTSEGRGQFKGNDQSNPYLGDNNKEISLDEVKIEIVFESYLEKIIQKTLQEVHPYEAAAFEIFSLDNTNLEVGMGRRHSPLTSKKINKVAVLGGSGSFAIEEAKKQGADAFITADLKYHQFYLGENSLFLVDVGHYESEHFTKKMIYDYLTKKMPNFAFVLSSIKTNPVNYF